MKTLIASLAFAGLSAAAAAATFTVVNTADNGAGSLRQAILDANASAGADTITFSIPGSGVHTITPLSDLPKLTDAVTIDGYTQPGSSPNTNGPGLPDNSVHAIEIDGTNTFGGNGGYALGFQGSFDFTLRGLVVNRAPAAAVYVETATGAIEGCFLGVDPTGLVSRPNAYGVEVEVSPGVHIGGSLAAQRNVISSNSNLQLAFGCLSQGGSGHVIQGNFIGTDATGAAAAANASTGAGGIGLCFTVSGVTIGGATSGERNVISGNPGTAVNIANSFGNDVVNNVVRGNFIGTDLTGVFAIGNGGTGVRINTPTNSVIDNVISAHGVYGVDLWGDGNLVQGNRIGTDSAGTLPLGNGAGGVHVVSSNNQIGGIGAGEPNTIAYNGAAAAPGHGVWVENGSGNAVRHNSIHDNVGLGIALGTDGVTANDPGDGDAGPNGLQNFPVLVTVTGTPAPGQPEGGSLIQGVLHSSPSTSYAIDAFSNPACVRFPKDFLEGQTFLGSGVVTTDGTGTGAFSFIAAGVIGPGEHVSVTATDPAGNTSEFSQRLPFSVSPASGAPAGGNAITVSGTDFAAGATVTIGSQPATSVIIGSSTSLTAAAPPLAAGSANDLVVTNTDGTTGTLVKGWVSDFLDVPAAQQFHGFVTTLVSNGITAGIGGGLYGVNDNTLRQQMAVFLLKAKHGLCYTPPPCAGVFSDVPCPSTFAPWIEALAAEGITGGCGGGKYCPQNPVRRDQMAVFLLKAEHGSTYVPPDCTGVFPDVTCPSPFANWIEQLAAENITGGCGGGNYCPGANNTRGQMAVFITKTFNLQ